MSLYLPRFPLPSEVAAEAARCFPDEDIALVLDVLHLYESEPGELHREWMQMRLVWHARGNLNLLLRSVERAKRGYKKYLDKVSSDAVRRAFEENPTMCISWVMDEPPERPLSRREAVEQMGVPWREFDRWIEEWKLRPLRQPGPTVFAVADLERLQREREEAER